MDVSAEKSTAWNYIANVLKMGGPAQKNAYALTARI